MKIILTITRGGAKLNLICRKNNSGNAGIPCNQGLYFARGEYILFVESDDTITKTALEELYPIAKKFDADVVHCERYFQFTDNLQKYTLEGYQTGELVKEPTLITENFAERVKDLYNKRFLVNLWSKLIRRDFIIENELEMINGMAHDALYVCCILCSAKRYVRVPNIINFYRVVESSLSHKNDDVTKTFQKWFHALNEGFTYLEKFLSEREFFQKRPDVKHLALEFWVRECCKYLQGLYAQYPSWQLDPLIRHELESVKDKTALMAFIFSRMNTFNLQLNQSNAIIYQMNAHIQKQSAIIQQLNLQVQTLQTK